MLATCFSTAPPETTSSAAIPAFDRPSAISASTWRSRGVSVASPPRCLLARVAAGGTALDPEVVSQLVRASRRTDGLAELTPREREVLALMAEGRSNAGISAALVISASVVEKHVASIFAKLGLPPAEADNRRVLAVLRHLAT